MTSLSVDDVALLRRTLVVAEAARARGDGPFGAAVVSDGKVVSLEPNASASALDPTAHAEVNAIRSACRAVGSTRLAGSVLYSSCEPCMMCAAAAVWAGIESVVYAAPIEALIQYPITVLFPRGSFQWSALPITRTLVQLEEGIELLSSWEG